jgi:iron complex outermembrane receptor protein
MEKYRMSLNRQQTTAPRPTRSALATAALAALLELNASAAHAADASPAPPAAAAATAATAATEAATTATDPAATGAAPAAPAQAATTAATATAPARAAPATQEPMTAVHVVGRRQSGDYNGRESEGATRTDTPVLEVPQSVRVMTRQLVDDLGALRVDDLLDHVAGVSRHNDFGGTWDNIAMRGFAGHEDRTSSLLRNGMPSNRGFNAPRDTANLERVEFLKGTMGALYGSSEPGGTVNLVTKQPRFSAGHSVELYAGSHDHRRLAIDSTGPLNGHAGEPATLAYRLNVSAEDKDSFRDHVHVRRTLVAPALAWRLGPDTRLRYDGEWLRQQAPLDRGVPVVNGRLDAVPPSRFYGEPGDGDNTIDNQTHQLFLNHALGAGGGSSDWELRAGLQHKRGSLSGRATEVHMYGPGFLGCATSMDQRDWFCRRVRDRDFTSLETSLLLEAYGRFATGALKHELIVGAEAARFSQDRTLLDHAAGLRDAVGISVSDPKYGGITVPAMVPVQAIWNGRLEDRQQALYVQDQVAWRDWRLLAGLRHDRAKSRYTGRIDGAVTRQEPSATSPRLGLSWLPRPGLSLYASIGRSFRPQSEQDAQGRPFEPQVGTARELGLKWESAGGRLGATLAWFDIAKRHVPQYIAATDSYAKLDRVRNRGLEAEVTGQVAPGWRVALAYAFLDADRHLAQFARHSGSAFVVHERALAGGGLVGIGGGVTHVGARSGEDPYAPPPQLPAYTLAKITSYWRVNSAVRLSLDVDNLFDRTWYASAYNRVWVTPGNPRQVTLGAQYKF